MNTHPSLKSQRLRTPSVWRWLSMATMLGCSEGGGRTDAHHPREEQTVSSIPFAAFACQQGDPFEGALQLSQVTTYARFMKRDGSHDALATTGAECQGAGDTAACKHALEEAVQASRAVSPTESPFAGYVHAVTQVQGGSVSRHDRVADLVRLLAPIDTPAEAWLLVMAYEDLPIPVCGDAASAASSARGNTFLLRWRYTSRRCDGTNAAERSEVLFEVSRTGDVAIRSRQVIEQPKLPCISSNAPSGR